MISKKGKNRSRARNKPNWADYKEYFEKQYCGPVSAKAAMEEVAKKYDISFEKVKSMRRRWKEDEQGRRILHGHCRLTILQEKVLVGLCLGMDRTSSPLSKRDLLEVVNKIHGTDEHPFTLEWVREFQNRWRDFLSLKVVRGIAESRTDAKIYDTIKSFVTFMEDFAGAHHFAPHTLVNVDECRVVLQSTQGTGYRLVSSTAKHSGSRGKRDRRHCSIVPFVTAGGKVVCVFIVLPVPASGGRVDLPTKVSGRQSNIPQLYYIFTESGYTDTASFIKMMQQFAVDYQAQYGNVEVAVFMDRLSSHLSPELSDILLHYSLLLCYFPGGATHILQPLDDVVFSAFKSSLKAHRDLNLSLALFARDTDAAPLLQAIIPALEQALAEGPIIKSFLQTGIFPWNAEEIFANAREAYPNQEAPVLELGTQANEVIEAVEAVAMERSKEKKKATTPYQVHRQDLGQVFTFGELQQKERAYQQRKAEEAAEKMRRRQEKAERSAKAAQEKEERRQARQVEREARKRKVEEEREVQAKRQKENTCIGCPSVRRNGRDWKFCQACNMAPLCPRCTKDSLKHEEWHRHIASCGIAAKPIPIPLPDDLARRDSTAADLASALNF